MYCPTPLPHCLHLWNYLFNFVKSKFIKMNRRLLQFLQAENLTQTQFADTLSVARGSVSHILAGRNKPGYDFMESLLLHFPRLNLEWLLTGKGRMYKDVSPEESSDPAQLELFSMPAIQAEPRKLEKIIVYYDDNTFQEFRASE